MPSISVVSHVRNDGSAHKSEFNGYDAKSNADKYFNEVIKHRSTIYAVHLQYYDAEEEQGYSARREYSRSFQYGELKKCVV